MIASMRDASNIFKECLAYLKNHLTSKCAPGQSLRSVGIKGLIGSETQYSVHNEPAYSPPTYIEIYFGDYHIVPIAYSLMGRRDPEHQHNYLRTWNFSGRTQSGKWELLHFDKDKPFSQVEERTFILKPSKTYNAFKIEMTDVDTCGEWALCIGQIDVFGYIYDHCFISRNGIFKSLTLKHLFVIYLFSFLNIIMIS